MASVSSTLNNLAQLTLIASDASYFTSPVAAGTPLAPLSDPNPTQPRYDFSAASGFTVATNPITNRVIEGSDPTTGGKYIVYLSQAMNQAIVAFGGTDGLNPKDWSQNTNLGWNQWQDMKTQLLPALSALADANPGLTINFTGQSLGGALAQYAIYDFVIDQTTPTLPREDKGVRNHCL